MVIVFKLDALKIPCGIELFAECVLKSAFKIYTCKEVGKVGLGRQKS